MYNYTQIYISIDRNIYSLMRKMKLTILQKKCAAELCVHMTERINYQKQYTSTFNRHNESYRKKMNLKANEFTCT